MVIRPIERSCSRQANVHSLENVVISDLDWISQGGCDPRQVGEGCQSDKLLYDLIFGLDPYLENDLEEKHNHGVDKKAFYLEVSTGL